MDSILLSAMGIVLCIMIIMISSYYTYQSDRNPKLLKKMGSILFASQWREIISWEVLGGFIILVFVLPAIFVAEVFIPFAIIICIFLPIMIFLSVKLRKEDRQNDTKEKLDEILSNGF